MVEASYSQTTWELNNTATGTMYAAVHEMYCTLRRKKPWLKPSRPLPNRVFCNFTTRIPQIFAQQTPTNP